MNEDMRRAQAQEIQAHIDALATEERRVRSARAQQEIQAHTDALSAPRDQAIQAHIDALETARDQAMQTFTAAAAAIAEQLRAYNQVWKAAARASMRHPRNSATPTQWFGHADLDPASSRYNPRVLAEALGRVFAAAGVNVTSIHMRAGRRQRRASVQRRS